MVLSEQDSSLGSHESSSLWIAVDSGCSLLSSATGKETARRPANTCFSLKCCGLLLLASSVLFFTNLVELALLLEIPQFTDVEKQQL